MLRFLFYASPGAAKAAAGSIISARTVSNALTIRLVLPAALSLSEQKFFLPAAAFATPAAANQVLVVGKYFDCLYKLLCILQNIGAKEYFDILFAVNIRQTKNVYSAFP